MPVEPGDIVPSFSEQQTLERAETFIPKEILNQLAEKGWKQRLEGMNDTHSLIYSLIQTLHNAFLKCE